MKKTLSSANAFTVLELLVVIAIIGILVALLLPALAAAGRKVQQVHCLGNVKQLTLGGHLMASDNDFEHAIPGLSKITNYVTLKILTCPSTHDANPPPTDSTAGTADTTWVWMPRGRMTATGSYTANAWLYSKSIPGTTTRPEFLFGLKASVQQPTLTPVYCDGMWLNCGPLETDSPSSDLYAGAGDLGVGMPTGMACCTILRHAGGNPAGAPRNFDTSKRLPGALNIGQLYWHKDWQPPATRPQ